MKGELHDVFEDESEDVYCEMRPCKKQRVKMLCYTCVGCTIKYEAKNKAKFSSCCGGDNVNFTFTSRFKFEQHLDEHRSRGENVPQEYYHEWS